MKKILNIVSFLVSFLVPFIVLGQGHVNDAYYGTTTGTNSYSVTINSITKTAPYDGQKIWVKFVNANTGASSLVVVSGNGTYAVKDIETSAGGALTSGMISANSQVALEYNSSFNSWQILGGAGSSGGTPGGSNTQLQYNNAGVFGGITGATTNGTAVTLVAPILGTPASGTLTNATGLPLTTGVTGNLPVTNLNSGTGASSSTAWLGNATWGVPPTAGSSASVTITDDNSTNAEMNLVWTPGSTGAQPLKVSSPDITYNPSIDRVLFNGTLDVRDTFLFGPNPPTEPEWDDYTMRAGYDLNSWSGFDFQNRSGGNNARAIVSVHAGPIGYSGVNLVQYGEGHTVQHPGWGPGIVTNAGGISAEVIGARLVISHSGNKPVQFATGDSIRMTVGPFGNKIGIGTMSPIATLHSNGTFNNVLFGASAFLSTEPYSFQRNDNSTNTFLIHNSIDGAAASSNLNVRAVNTLLNIEAFSPNFTTSGIRKANTVGIWTDATTGMNIGLRTLGPLALWTNNLERVKVDENGLVGINTGTVAIGFQFVTNLNTSATSSVQSSIQMKTTSSGSMADDFGGGILMAVRDVDNVDNNIAGMTALRKGADNSGMWAVRTASGGSLTYHLNVASNGNVAINNGTNTALSKLDVGGNLAVGTGFAGIVAAPTNGALIQGLVGIGTSTPSAHRLSIVSTDAGASAQTAMTVTMTNTVVASDNTALSVNLSSSNGDANVAGNFIVGGGTDARAGFFQATGATTNTGGFFNASGGTNNYALVTNLGSVGIGTITPTEFFQIAGSTYSVNVTSTGRMGIGVTPTAQLHFSAGTTTANTGPIKLTEGVNPTTPENGIINYVANNVTFTETSTVYTLLKALNGSATLDFPSTAFGTHADLTITVTGAAVGDPVSLGPGVSPGAANTTFWAFVSNADEVTVRFNNNALVGSVDPGSGTFRVSVIKQ